MLNPAVRNNRLAKNQKTMTLKETTMHLCRWTSSCWHLDHFKGIEMAIDNCIRANFPEGDERINAIAEVQRAMNDRAHQLRTYAAPGRVSVLRGMDADLHTMD